MKQIVAGLLALCTVLAITAGVAQATPELLVVPPGTLPNPIKGSGNVALLNTTGGNNIECKSNTISGEQVSTTKAKLTVKFRECSKGCKTEGVLAKEVWINWISPSENVTFVLDLESGATHVYGFLLKKPYPKIECTALTVNVEGELIIPTTLELLHQTTATTFQTEEAALGVQLVTTCEEPTTGVCVSPTTHHNLTANFGAGGEEAALVGSDAITFGELVEPVN